MFCITLYRVEDLNRKEVRELILMALDSLWISGSFSLLIEIFYGRPDNVRSLRVFRLQSGYRLEIVVCNSSDRKTEPVNIVRDRLDKDIVAQQLRQILSGGLNR